MNSAFPTMIVLYAFILVYTVIFVSCWYIFVGFQPIILIPQATACTECNGYLVTESRPSLVNLYANSGRKKASLFHKKCANCRMKFYLSYKVSADGVKAFDGQCRTDEYFLISSKTGFQTLFLKITSDLIETAGITFTAAAESYETTHKDHMERQRLEEAYFLLKLIEFYSAYGEDLCVDVKDETCRVDLESLCKKALALMTYEDNPFIHHTCDTAGCKEGFAMADGIEKVRWCIFMPVM